MKKHISKSIAAILFGVATIVVSASLCSCEGRKMSNMEPTGDTVEVMVQRIVADSVPGETADSDIN